MRRLAWSTAVAVLVGCGGGGDDTSDDTADEGCGSPVTHTITVTGHVVDSNGARVAGADVSFVDRAWAPGTLDQGVTDANGNFTLVADELTWLPRCYGTALSYWVVATDGARTDEKAVNQRIFGAIEDETFAFSLDQFPMTLP